MSKDSLDPRIIELLKRKLPVSPYTIPSAISRMKERYPFLTLNAAAEVFASRYHVSVHRYLNDKDREALGTFAVGKTNMKTKQKPVHIQKPKKIDRPPVVGKPRIEKANEVWDVFICYKRISGEDFADSLKKFLEEFNIHAFLDTKDIPAKFRGTDQWTDTRDNAVIKCKVFALIMTAGFDSSAEVKKELTLARSVPCKLFAYFRHKDLPASVKIVLKKEVLDLGKQQQHVFVTSNELVRIAHKILVDGKQISLTDTQGRKASQEPSEAEVTREIVEKYREKIFDEKSEDPLPYKACPQCGSPKLMRNSSQIQGDTVLSIECSECGWSDGQVL